MQLEKFATAPWPHAMKKTRACDRNVVNTRLFNTLEYKCCKILSYHVRVFTCKYKQVIQKGRIIATQLG